MMARVTALGLLTGLLLLAGRETASAQSLWVKGGINVSTIKVSPSEELGVEVTGKVAVTVGGSLTFRDAATLGYEVGGQLSMRRVAFGPDITDTITYIEVPVLARYAFV